MMKIYVYFIACRFIEKGKEDVSRAEVGRPKPIEKIEDIEEIELFLQSKLGLDFVIITNYQLLRTETL